MRPARFGLPVFLSGVAVAAAVALRAVLGLAAQNAKPESMPVAPPPFQAIDLKPFTTGAAAATLTEPSYMAHVKYLASEELAGRGNGEPGLELAAEYVAEKFKEYGLSPAGPQGSYFQPYLVTVGSKRGPDNALTATRTGEQPYRRSLKVGEEFEPFGMSPKKTVEAALVFLGYGITAKDAAKKIDYDDYSGIDVKGKIVVIMRFEPTRDKKSVFTGTDRWSGNSPFDRKLELARKAGAAGVVFITPPDVKDDEGLGLARQVRSGGDEIPVVLARRAFLEELLKAEGKDLAEIQKQINVDLKPRSFELTGTRVSLSTDVVRERKTLRNVLARLDGADPKLKDEFLVIGGHYDHLGRSGGMKKEDKGKIHYGADDNASGTAAVLELARVFAQQKDKLKRSVVFMAFSGEEIGLFGSRHWVNNPTVPLKSVAAMINLDMVGRHKDKTLHVIGAGTSPQFKPMLEAFTKDRGLNLKAGGGPTFGGSDHMSFESKDIPVLFFHTGLHADYHRPSDTADKVLGAAAADLIQIVHAVAWQLNLQDERPKFTRQTAVAHGGAAQPGGGGFSVYFGSIPDYAYDGKGVRFEGVAGGGPAEKAGIKSGDVLTKIGEREIANLEDFMSVLRTRKPGDEVEVTLNRAKDVLKLKVKLEARK
jgi:hypothetical protein